MIALTEFRPEVAQSKKAAKLDENTAPSQRRKKKVRTTEIKPHGKKAIVITMAKPSGTSEALQMKVIKKEQTSKKRQKSSIHSGFNDQLGDILPSSRNHRWKYMRWVVLGSCLFPPTLLLWQHDRRQVQPRRTFCACFARSAKPQSDLVFLERIRVFLRSTMHMYRTEVAVNGHCILLAESDVCKMTLELRDLPLALSYFSKRCPEELNEGYTILKAFADVIRAPLRVCQALNQPESFELMTFMQLEAYIL